VHIMVCPKSMARAWIQEQLADTCLQVGSLRATGLRHVSQFSQDAALLDEAQRKPFISSSRYTATTDIPSQK
jgi:hypothetical protein